MEPNRESYASRPRHREKSISSYPALLAFGDTTQDSANVTSEFEG